MNKELPNEFKNKKYMKGYKDGTNQGLAVALEILYNQLSDWEYFEAQFGKSNQMIVNYNFVTHEINRIKEEIKEVKECKLE